MRVRVIAGCGAAVQRGLYGMRLRWLQEADPNKMAFDDLANGRQQARHVAPVHPLPALRIEYGFQLFDDE